jgi:hypothetical protein
MPEAKSSLRRKKACSTFLTSSSKNEAFIQMNPENVIKAKLLLTLSLGFLRKTNKPRARSRKDMMDRRIMEALSIGVS